MRCLRALGEWDEVAQLASALWFRLGPDQASAAATSAAMAAAVDAPGSGDGIAIGIDGQVRQHSQSAQVSDYLFIYLFIYFYFRSLLLVCLLTLSLSLSFPFLSFHFPSPPSSLCLPSAFAQALARSRSASGAAAMGFSPTQGPAGGVGVGGGVDGQRWRGGGPPTTPGYANEGRDGARSPAALSDGSDAMRDGMGIGGGGGGFPGIGMPTSEAGAGVVSGASQQQRDARLREVAMNVHEANLLSARAAWALGDWSLMAKHVCCTSSNTVQGMFLRSVLMLHRDRFDVAVACIDRTRSLLDAGLSAQVAESYERAYRSLVTLQQLAEMEEITRFKRLAKKARLPTGPVPLFPNSPSSSSSSGSISISVASSSSSSSTSSFLRQSMGARARSINGSMNNMLNMQQQQQLQELWVDPDLGLGGMIRSLGLSGHGNASGAAAAGVALGGIRMGGRTRAECRAEARRYKKHMQLVWAERLRGCQRTVDVWQRILSGRSLVLTPR